MFTAIKGSSVVFGVTNFWEKGLPEVEVAQGKAMADASKEAGVERFIWSSLPNVSKETNGENTAVKHFDSKAAVETYVRSIGLPATFLMPGLFMKDTLGQIKANDEGVYVWTTPFISKTTRVPLFDPVDDTGSFALAALLEGDAALGKRITASSGWLTPDEVLATYSKVTGRKTVLNTIPVEVFKKFLPPAMADDLAGNMQLILSPGYFAGEPASSVDDAVALTKKHGLKVTSWEDFVRKNTA